MVRLSRDYRLSFSIGLSAVLVLSSFQGLSVQAASAPGPSATDEITVESISAERSFYGLATSELTVIAVRAHQDEWPVNVGIPMTPAEAKELRLAERWQFEATVDDEVMPWLKKRPDFGGAYFDPLDNGNLKVLLTDKPDVAFQQTLEDSLKNNAVRVGVQIVDSTYVELEQAADAVMDAWRSSSKDSGSFTVGIRTSDNAIVVRVAPGLSLPPDVRSAATRIGVRVITEAGTGVTDFQTCGLRSSCWDPMRPGIRITNNTGEGCSMGFAITHAWSNQFLTSGHCSWGANGDNWFHYAYGAVGNVAHNCLETLCPGMASYRDVEVVSFFDSAQASYKIYDPYYLDFVETGGDPIQNESVCASYGWSNKIDCGTISSEGFQHYAPEFGVTIKGLAAVSGVTSQDGDSGSPYYHRINPAEDVAARGVHVGVVDGWVAFAKIESIIGNWNASLIVDPD